MKYALLGVLLAQSVLAGNLRDRLVTPIPTADRISAVSYTGSAMTLYVDPTGSDSNACTSTGTAACLTIQGALNKVPKALRHQVTINVAAGSYAGATISGFTVDPAFQRANAGILIDGVLANVTPATGSATGTATAGSAGSTTTYGTLTDSGATWTTSDLVGKFIVITGGTGSGQTKVITANTGTVITIAGTWTAPNGTSTYAIQSPSAIINTAVAVIPTPLAATSVNAAGIQIVNNLLSGSNITIRNIAVTAATTNSVVVDGPSTVLLTQFRSTGATSQSINAVNQANLTCTTCSLVGAAAVQAIRSFLTSSNSYIQSTSSSAISLTQHSVGSLTSNQIVVGSSGASGVLVRDASKSTMISLRCNCASASTSSCLQAGITNALTSQQGLDLIAVATALDVTDCSNGIWVNGSAVTTFTSTATFTGNALTYGANTVFGGSLVIGSTVPTITGGTAEMSVDSGGATANWNTLAAIYSCITATGTNSRICRL